MVISDATWCFSLAAALPELTTLSSQPWTTGNIIACTAQGLTCNNNNQITSIILTGLTTAATIPSGLDAFIALTTISMDAPFTGDLPSGLPIPLATLTLKEARFTGSIPAAYNNIWMKSFSIGFDPTNTNPVVIPTNLRGGGYVLEFYRGYFTSIPTVYGGLTNITFSDCRFSSDVTGIGSTFWTTFQYYIQSFNFSVDPSLNFGATDTFPTSSMLSNFPFMKALSLSGWAAAGPLATGYPMSLASVTLRDMPNLVSTLPAGLFVQPSYVELSNLPFVTSSIPMIAGGLPLRTLKLNKLGISGTIQNDIFDSNIEALYITNCPGIASSLPANRVNSAARIVNISNNLGVIGTIPAYTMPSLTSLTLDNLGVTAISSTMGELPSGMMTLSISGNTALVGTIPSISFSIDANQAVIVMKNNAFTGTIPMSLGSFSGLQYYKTFDFSGNDLDLCANAGVFGQDMLSATLNDNGFCNLTTVGNPQFACPGIWNANCFYLPPPIEPVTPPTTPPIEPITPPIEPVTPPTTIPIDEPITPVTPPTTPPVEIPSAQPITPVAIPIEMPVALPIAQPIAIPSAEPIAPTSIPDFEPTSGATKTITAIGFFVTIVIATILTL